MMMTDFHMTVLRIIEVNQVIMFYSAFAANQLQTGTKVQSGKNVCSA